MASSSRRFNQAEFDPMQEHFDNSNYENQHAGASSGDLPRLDNSRLYVKNIPKVLNEEGLKMVFAKYGTVTHTFFSHDPHKRYALVTYETPADARHAMMKLDKLEPLKMSVRISHESKSSTGTQNSFQAQKNERKDNQNNRTATATVSHSHSSREKYYDNVSVGSWNKNRKPEDLSNGEIITSMEENKMDIGSDLGIDDPDLLLELDRLKLESLRLHQEELQCQQRLLIKQAEKRAMASNVPPSNRCVVSNGRIMIKSLNEGSDRRDPENFAAGAGDSRVASRACVSCGGVADSYCARCGVTPYCSERCQRRDWPARHSTVCHNLARLNDVLDVNNSVAASTIPNEAPAPLRRPHSPGSVAGPAPAPARGPVRERDERDDGSKKFLPPGHNPKPQPRSPRKRFDRDRADEQPHGGGAQGPQRRPYDKPPRHFSKPDMNKPMRRPQVDEDDWGFKGPKTNGAHEEPKPNVPPVEKRAEIKPPMREAPPTDKPANQEASLPAKSSIRSTVTPQAASQKETGAAPAPASHAKPPGDASGTTPSTKLVPKNCVVETLSVGDTVYLQVDNTAAACAGAGAGATGFVCVSLGDAHMETYQTLCESYTLEDESAVPATPGKTVSLFEPADGAWYRARVLSADRAALLDASKVVPVSPGTKLAALPPPYAAIPEFCCLLQADAKIGDNFIGTVVEKTGRGWKVSLECEGGAPRSGEVSRWLPAVCYPAPPPATATAPAPTTAPAAAPTTATNNASAQLPHAKPVAAAASVSRPSVTNNSTVLLVHFTSTSEAGAVTGGAGAPPAELFVRPADARALRAFDAALHDVALYGLDAAPLREPPRAGQCVVGKFTDGVHYRALVRRTSVARDKYQLEYLEYGNIHVAQLKDLCACPPHLSLEQMPVLTSRVALQGASLALTPAADTYLEALKEDTELVLTLPNGEKTAPSGAEVILTVAKNKDCVNKRVQELSTPEWLALQQKGGDVVDVEPVMYSALSWLELSEAGGEMCVLDTSSMDNGLLSACPARHPHMALVLGSLTARINAYCESELGREPYLPKVEELCLAQLPPYPQWFRAVVLSHTPGAVEAEVNYIDYGTVAQAPVANLRKMLKEFVHQLPALAATLIIRGFPKNPTLDQQLRAAEFMKINDEGQGTLHVTNCKLESPELPGLYEVDAPELLKAMGQ